MRQNLSFSCLVFLILLLTFNKSIADERGGCMTYQVSTSDKVRNSSSIVEGVVVSKTCYQSREGTANIYTVNEVKVFKSFKGKISNSIYIVTLGGQVGLFAMKATSENNFSVGDQGIFFLAPARFGLEHSGNNSNNYFEVYSAEQGFLKYNLEEKTAIGPYDVINNYPTGVYNWLKNNGASDPIIVQPGPIATLGNPKDPSVLSVPTITSFSPTSLTAGTRTLLTITGTNFGATRGTGFVEFRNANNPGAVDWIQPKANDYRVWNNTQIQVWVPSNSNGNGPSAGTGQIRVTNSTVSPNQATSTGTLTITYAAINVEFNSTGFATEHNNDNSTGGYTFQYHAAEFAINAAATASFVRAMNTWTCATNINWIVGPTTTLDVTIADNVNVVRFDNGAELQAGVLGRATSYFNGCINGAAPNDTVWECNEIDVQYDDATSWQFGPALPSASQIDFESVTVHELGHAHQLDHVINTSAVMHATVGFGVSKRTLLAASEEAGGDFQMTKAFAVHGGCKPIAEVMTPLDISGTVSIAASPSTSICSGASVTFTATASVPVGTFTYEWKKNGTNVGTNSATYTDATLTNGNTIQCVVTVTGGCNLILSSNTITMTVTSSVTPSVSISANPGVSICAGSSVTFTAVPTNGGITPAYQWKVNGVNAGTNSTTFTTTTLTNGQVVTCVLTSNAACATTTTATSNSLTMAVTSVVTPSVSISANPDSSICAGASVTFTAVPTNGGTTPAFQWKVNGVNAGINSSTFTTTTLTNGQIVTCVLTSNAPCVSPNTATSNSITMTVTNSVTPSVSISSNIPSTFCFGTSITFTATPTNGGTTPSYQWKVSGVNVGTNSNTFTSSSLTNGQIVTCVLTSNATCASPTTATSNSITMTVASTVTPSVSIAASPGSSICSGTSVTFTATPTNGGTTPAYQWKVDGVNAGTNTSTFTSSTLTNGQVVTCVLTSNANCPSPASVTSNSITMNVTTTVIPSVIISANPGSTICTGSSVTFTAIPTNGGTTPSYQWKVNGVNAGTNSATFTTSTLTNGQIVTCVLTSNAACASTTTATSNSITMTVNPIVTPSLSIGVSPGTIICAGTSVTFFAAPTNGGTTPSYQWKVNGVNAGTNSSLFTTTTLTNGQTVSCVMTSNAACASTTTATSNNITMTVSPTVTPSVSISANPGSTICAGTSVTFTAIPTNGGTTPVYQWKINGGNVGTNSATFTSTTLTNGQVVTCDLTSNANCPSPATVTSNSITMAVSNIVTPSVSISANPGSTICAGTSVTFTAIPTNGGTTPSYQWKVNGVNVGTNSTTFTTTTITSGQIVSCVLTSNASCASTTTATSNSITMTVNAIVTPSVSISASPGNTICAGSSVTFTAIPTNGGTTPSYQWKVNGVNAGTNSATFTTTSLTNGQVVTCVLTSNATCASPTTATSNNITMTVTNNVTPSVLVTANPGTTICQGTSVTFTATPTNGGATPSYQWKSNGTNVGTNSPTFTTAALANGTIISCVLTSNAICASPTTATGSFTASVNPKPFVNSFSPSSGSVGTTVTINGFGFSIATSVTFGASSTTTFTKQGDTLILVNVPAGATTSVISVSNANCTGVSSQTFTINPSNSTLNLKAYLQGYYLGSGLMNSVLVNQSVGTNSNQVDTLTVELRNAINPSIIVSSRKSVLSTNGNAIFTFPSSIIGNSYYIAVTHRNAVQTWSAAPVAFSSTTTSYDFTTSANKAYSSNQVEVESSIFAFYSGDINQDENIDITDQPILEGDVSNGLFGYYATDINGDGNVDISDTPLLENNVGFGVFSAHP